MRGVPWVRFVVFVLAFAPALAHAQATITGLVKDSSGAVLPGVVVEATSPALIEKVRSAVTDGSGQYRIVDLRPGVYSVTFTLTGFNTVKREGIELTGTFTSTVNADLRVGSLEETITVTGESPIVDVQSVRRQTTVDGDVIAALPTSRSYGALFQLVPAVTGGSRDVLTRPGLVVFGGPGGRGTEGRLQVDGLGVGAPLSGGGVSGYLPDIANAQEVTFTTSGGLGEAEVGGPTMNIVPKTGGNAVRGTIYAAGVGNCARRQQLHRRIAGRWTTHARRAAQAVGHQWRRRRAHQKGSRVVLRELARRRQLAIGARHVSESERRRPNQVHLRARPHEAGRHGE
jgi:hypothetical protein